MKKISIILICELLWSFITANQCAAQSDSITYNISIGALGSTGKSTPQNIQNNKYGMFLSDTAQAYFKVGINKDYNNSPKHFDYGFGVNVLGRTNDENKNEIYLHELYAKAKYLFLEMHIGSMEEIIGNQDSTLSSGGFLFSKNSRPMPKIAVGIYNYIPVPLTHEYLHIKGSLSHGWFAKEAYEQGAFLHHKNLYLKLGGAFPINIEYGLEHAAMWGGDIPGIAKQRFNFSTYKTVFFGESGDSSTPAGEQINTQGNHIISQSIKLTGNLNNITVATYWQNLSEDGPIKIIGKTMNSADGLWGVLTKFKKFNYVKKILYEFINTTDQSGPFHDRDGIVFGGADSYFINYIYHSGWTYYNRIIGTPLISGVKFNNSGEITEINNRVMAHHLGIEGDISGIEYRLLVTKSNNYGSYSNVYSPIKRNTSISLDLYKNLPEVFNLAIGGSLGADIGNMYGNNFGMLITVRKTGLLFKARQNQKRNRL